MTSKTDNLPISDPLSSLHISDNKENQQIHDSSNEETTTLKNVKPQHSNNLVLTQDDDDDQEEEDDDDQHHLHQQEVKYNELTTIKKCLLALKNVEGYRELFPFQYKLNQFIAEDKENSDLKTKNLLTECIEIMHDIVKTLEEKGVKNIDQIDGGGFTNVDDEVEIKRNRYHEFQEADYDLDSEAYGSESEPEGNDYY